MYQFDQIGISTDPLKFLSILRRWKLYCITERLKLEAYLSTFASFIFLGNN